MAQGLPAVVLALAEPDLDELGLGLGLELAELDADAVALALGDGEGEALEEADGSGLLGLVEAADVGAAVVMGGSDGRLTADFDDELHPISKAGASVSKRTNRKVRRRDNMGSSSPQTSVGRVIGAR